MSCFMNGFNVIKSDFYNCLSYDQMWLKIKNWQLSLTTREFDWDIDIKICNECFSNFIKGLRIWVLILLKINNDFALLYQGNV